MGRTAGRTPRKAGREHGREVRRSTAAGSGGEGQGLADGGCGEALAVTIHPGARMVRRVREMQGYAMAFAPPAGRLVGGVPAR
ncbi:hypothetical protein Sxan_30480 [Streptomyces xanthophaeus]|uniref:Uncharacterized protein n=1 Tax=Streptomyces xanthophaeus TaxID=67385 RepID=A0A919LIP1_9ACTN|nr:hypothetical protein Sxan_30480 [Streptomyces xanthophaeus]